MQYYHTCYKVLLLSLSVEDSLLENYEVAAAINEVQTIVAICKIHCYDIYGNDINNGKRLSFYDEKETYNR